MIGPCKQHLRILTGYCFMLLSDIYSINSISILGGPRGTEAYQTGEVRILNKYSVLKKNLKR